MTCPLWPFARLEALLSHSEPAVQKWAASKLFNLYPREAGRALPRLLEDERPTVVSEALEFLRREPSEELIPILGGLYLNGPPSISARAMYCLGDLRYPGAVDWMKERILEERPLVDEQIVAMMYAMGRVRSDDGYMLLKEAEKSIQERDSRHWEMFYASLLQYRRADDVLTLLAVAMDEDEDKARYRESLGLLLGEVDPMLNPSNVFFTNTGPVRKRWLKRIEEIKEGSVSGESPGAFDILRDLVNSVNPEAMRERLETLEKVAADLEGTSPFDESIYRQALRLMEKGGVTGGKSFALICLTISAMLNALEERAYPPPDDNDPCDVKVAYLLGGRPPKQVDEALADDVVSNGEREVIVPLLISALEKDPRSWGAVRAVDMLGRLRAQEALKVMVGSFRKAGDDFFADALRTALIRIGVSSAPCVIPLLDSSDAAETSFALEVLGLLPTREGVDGLLERSASLHAEHASSLLEAMYEIGSDALLRPLEKEYRPGEWEIGKVFVHICRVNDLRPEGLAEIERDVLHGETMLEDQRRMMAGSTSRWPTAIQLELECRECGKKYHYEVSDVHLHPYDTATPATEAVEDRIPYKHGIVVSDDLRCKNCHALNRMLLTAGTLSQMTAESVRILALQKGVVRIPASYPVKHVRLDEKEGKPRTLVDAERESLEALGRSPAKPAAHLALGKFYEYVKEFLEAKRYHLQALNLDSQALEAMAGLARLAYAEGNLKEAGVWIEDCYENLEKGHIFLASDPAAFKKTVRLKRREYARELGVKPEDKPVKILFSVYEPEHPKNKPCPCGSGKKYKLCCMKTGGPERG